ncbi:MAG: histidinol-phosphate transaminase [Lachnospiraceae bacterium]|nr:histidinol-phosphate transaminase [Lachnospiraceae bacterium]
MYIHGGIHFEQPNFIDFSANINPFGMPDAVREAAERGVQDAVYYPDTVCRELRDAIGIQEKRSSDEIIVGNGAAELLFRICQSVRPENALIIAPSFQEYEQALKSVSCICHYYDLPEAEDFHVEVEELVGRLPGMELLFLCNPNNPTGELLSGEKICHILDACVEYGVRCVLDECFLEFCEGESMVPYLGKYENLFIIKAFTKLYAMPGLRLGYGLTADRKLLHKMNLAGQPWSVSVPAQYAGVAALQEREYVKRSIAYISNEREYLLSEMRQHMLCKRIFDSRANYIFFRAEETLGAYLYERGYAIRDCSNYRNLQKGYYRIAVRLHEENMALLQEWKEYKKHYSKEKIETK